jgi:ABC-type nitrate/sulfonate/bicarbonate transport system ATPase subunit
VTAGAPVSLRDIGHTYTGHTYTGHTSTGHTSTRTGTVEAVERVDVDIAGGELVALVGPSGCGKSTLLRILAGLLVPSRGTARVGDVVANGRAGLVAYQPQHDLLLPWRRVLANATLGAEVAGIPARYARAQATARMERFGLQGFERAWPVTLSGGMRQRVALLRTFLVPRPVLLLDEPFGALDAITRRSMQEWLQDVWTGDGRTVVLVTHDVEEALLLADRVLVMSRRPGRLVDEVGVAFARPRGTDLLSDTDFVAAKRHLVRLLSA